MITMRRPIGYYVLVLSWIGHAHGQVNTSDVPSAQPSGGPTRSPTALPTVAPTFVPSSAPTVTVTLSPTNATEPPTTSPTVSPTAGPTGTPTLLPSVSPSANLVETTVPPTTSPSSAPTVNNETDIPTLAPSPNATDAPTTDTPTVSPVSNATFAPTAPPVTAIPSAVPSVMPSAAPNTMAPVSSAFPSSSPFTPGTNMPTLAPAPAMGEPVQLTINGLQIDLAGVGMLDAGAQTVFMTATKDFYEQTVYGEGDNDVRRRLQAVEGVSDFTTTIVYAGQEVGDDGNTVEYSQEISYVSTTEATPFDVIRNPFNDADLSSLYAEQLRSRGGDAFAGLTTVEAPVVVEPRDDDDDDDGLGIGAIIGIIVGAVVLLAIGICLVTRSGKSGTHEQLNERENPPPATFSAMQSEDVSTMDDQGINRTGTGETGSILDVGDQSVATVDYDYSKAYGGADNSVVSSAGGTMGENTRETGSALQSSARAALGASFDSEGKPDGNVREEVIEINAPAGKLGVVIDTPDEGAPVVHAVKDSSVIADLIHVGDKLVAVDDEDVTAMTAIKVSKLISKKSANPSRKLTIIRQVAAE